MRPHVYKAERLAFGFTLMLTFLPTPARRNSLSVARWVLARAAQMWLNKADAKQRNLRYVNAEYSYRHEGQLEGSSEIEAGLDAPRTDTGQLTPPTLG